MTAQFVKISQEFMELKVHQKVCGDVIQRSSKAWTVKIHSNTFP